MNDIELTREKIGIAGAYDTPVLGLLICTINIIQARW